jgi:DnaJ-class molecular chaperone
LTDEILVRDLSRAALAYAAHQSARCAHLPLDRDCACSEDEFRRQAHLARGHRLCPTCLGAREVVVHQPPARPHWVTCAECAGLGNVDPDPPEGEDDESEDREALLALGDGVEEEVVDGEVVRTEDRPSPFV